MRNIIKIATVGLSACAMLALAQPASAENAASASTAKASEGQKADGKAAAKKICLRVDLETGTRLSKQSCRTKEEWAEEGVEIGSKG